MNISYDHYAVFYYVAKYGSFTKAANALLLNQPNLTRTVKSLEEKLGRPLFERSNMFLPHLSILMRRRRKSRSTRALSTALFPSGRAKLR